MIKKIVTLGIIMIGILLYPSCDDNPKSAGNFRIDIATVIPDGDNSYSLLLDNGVRLYPHASDVSYMPVNTQRVFLNYTILSDKKGVNQYDIIVNDIWNILTKPVIELNSENRDSIGNDPVKTEAVWVGGDYLNVSFLFNYGGVRPHMVNLVKNKPASDENDEKDSEEIELEFRHNSYHSNNTKLFEGFVCFDLKPFMTVTADSVKLSVKVKQWNGEKKYNVVYRYNQPVGKVSAINPPPVISSKEYY